MSFYRKGSAINFRRQADVCLCDHPEVAHYRSDGSCVVTGCGCKGFRGRGSKMGNKHAKCGLGHSHDSGAESRICAELEMRRKAGDIKSFVFHPLEELFGQNKSLIGTYEVDFRVVNADGSVEWIEVKGRHLAREMGWRLKWALLQDKWKFAQRTSFRVIDA